MDWSGCPVVVARPGYLSGAPALRDDPRVPPETIVDNIDFSEAADDHAAAMEVIENFGLKTPLQDVLAVYDYATRQRAANPV